MQSNVNVTCTASPSCVIDARMASNVTVTCTASSCAVDCRDTSNCHVTCTPGSRCELQCASASNCSFSGCLAETDCGGGRIVCGRPC